MTNNQKQNTNSLEDQIISLMARKDKKAIVLLYDNYSAALYGIIIRTITVKEVANEVLQDVFLKVWKNADKYNPNKGRLFTWLAQIARNSAIDVIRSGKYQRSNKTESLDINVSKNVMSTLMAESDIGLRMVVNNLDEKYRILVNYIYFENYTQSEVAQELKIPIGTVKTRIRYAIVMLRKLLKNELNLVPIS